MRRRSGSSSDGPIVTSVGRPDHDRLLPLLQEAMGGYPEAMLGLTD